MAPMSAQVEEPSSESVAELRALYTLTERLIRADGLEPVFAAALDAICGALGCERASILLFDEAEVMRFVAWRGLSDRYRAAVDGHTPWRPSDRDAVPIFVDDIRATSEPNWLKEVIESEDIRALGFIPLLSRNGVIGKFMLYHGSPHVFREREIELAVTIARHVALAVTRFAAERDRERIADDLRLSEERFRAMSEEAPVMIWTSDAAGSCLHLNRMLREFWGVGDSLQAFDWSTTLHPDDLAMVGGEVAKALERRAPFRAEARYRRADGEWRILETVARPQFDTAGRFRGMIGVNLDVTERVRAEQALRDGERRFRDLAETMPQLVWTSDAVGRVDYWNSRIAAYAGAHRSADGAFDWRALIHPDDLEATGQAWTASVATSCGFQMAHRLAMRDGSHRWHLSRAVPVAGEEGRILAWYGTATDIHDQRVAEERLAESVERQTIAVAAAGLGVFDWDPIADRVLWENERMYEIFGRDRTEDPLTFVGLLDWVHPDDLDLVRSALDVGLKPDGSFALSFRIVRRSDRTTRWLDVAARVDLDAAGRAARMVGVVADVTERTLAEEHRKLLTSELNHRVKNTLSVVQSLARQTFRGQRPMPAVEAFDGRLRALARAHDELTREDWAGASLADIARATLTDRTGQSHRVRISGPAIDLSPKQALTAAMCLHELHTNATKYGALANDVGTVGLTWTIDPGSGRLRIEWRESGGPTVVRPERQGFGMTMMERALRTEFDADIVVAFEPEGLRCIIEADLAGPAATPATAA